MVAAIIGRFICEAASIMRAPWRWVTWEISWPTTEASSDSVCVSRIRPVWKKMNPPGTANALMTGLSMTKKLKSP